MEIGPAETVTVVHDDHFDALQQWHEAERTFACLPLKARQLALRTGVTLFFFKQDDISSLMFFLAFRALLPSPLPLDCLIFCSSSRKALKKEIRNRVWCSSSNLRLT